MHRALFSHALLDTWYLNLKSVLKGLIFVISMPFVQITMVLTLVPAILGLKIFSLLMSLLEVKCKLKCTKV